jgi:hypothetical protein
VKLKHDKLLSNVAFSYKVRQYSSEVRVAEEGRGEEARGVLFMTVTETGGGIGAQLRKLCGMVRHCCFTAAFTPD